MGCHDHGTGEPGEKRFQPFEGVERTFPCRALDGFEVLRQQPDAKTWVSHDAAGVRRLSGQEAQQRALAGSVGPDDADPAGRGDVQRHSAEDGADPV